MRFKGVYLLYRVIQAFGSPLIVLYFLVRGIRNPQYFKNFRQRLGFLPGSFAETPAGSIWLHAVSVGEVLSSLELVRRLRVQLPSAPIYLSTSTLAGMRVAREKASGVVDGIFFAPLDYVFAVRRVLRTIRPKLTVVLETEIWPNLFREARRFGAGLVIVNGRISDKALPRYRRAAWLFRAPLQMTDAILAQDDLNRQRFIELGADPERCVAAGNLKYDFDPRRAPMPEAVRSFVERVRPERVWIAASTMPPAVPGDPDEDDDVIAAFQSVAAKVPRLLLIHVPRKPERFDETFAKIAAAGIPVVRRSTLSESSDLRLPGVLLLDSMGELSGVYPLADVVFMGGTLVHRGGHNILEPALCSKPVVYGPHMENFAAIAAKFSNGGALQITSGTELAPAMARLLADGSLRAEIGCRALELAKAEQGATDRAVAKLSELYWRSFPRAFPPMPVRPFLRTLSALWVAGTKFDRAASRQSRLATPVVSIGGLAVGGAGKSPLVLWLAEQMKVARIELAILTRGYRRKSPERYTVAEPGENLPVERTGDEAQVYVRSAVCPVGIGADRALAGRLLEERFRPGVFILDDGFQHWRLHRDLDVVALDALDPFGGGEVIPTGRLRERASALGRAGAIVITRVRPGQDLTPVEAEIRKFNAAAPIFHSRVVPSALIAAGTGGTLPPQSLAGARVVAFCGLGNPASFWQTLSGLGCSPAARLAFPDHHRYTESDLLRIAHEARAAGAEILVTTEKDLMNLPPRWPALVRPLRLYWLKIGIELDRPQELLAFLQERIARARAASV